MNIKEAKIIPQNQESLEPIPEKVVWGWFRYGTDHGYWIYDSVEELEQEIGIVGLSKELTYGMWINDDATDMTATLLTTFESCPFMWPQRIYEKERGYYSYDMEPAFIGMRRYTSQEPLEEFGDHELAMTILSGEYCPPAPEPADTSKEALEFLQGEPPEELHIEMGLYDDIDFSREILRIERTHTDRDLPYSMPPHPGIVLFGTETDEEIALAKEILCDHRMHNYAYTGYHVRCCV